MNTYMPLAHSSRTQSCTYTWAYTYIHMNRVEGCADRRKIGICIPRNVSFIAIHSTS